MIEKKRIEIFPKHMGFFRICGSFIYYFHLPFSAGVRVEAYNWEQYVDNFIITYRQLYFVQRTFIFGHVFK